MFLQAQSWANASHSSHDQTGKSTETAISSRKRHFRTASHLQQLPVKRSCSFRSHDQHTVQHVCDTSPQSPDRTGRLDHAKDPAELDGPHAVTSNPDTAAKACHMRSLSWALHSARTRPGKDQQATKRSHPWGSSLVDNAAAIPYSNKAFIRLLPSGQGSLPASISQAMTEGLCAQKPSAQAVRGSTVPQSNSHTSMQQASAFVSGEVLHEPDGLCVAADSHRLHQCQPGTTIPAGTTTAPQCEGSAQQSRQGFWQELQGVLSQLPDHRGPIWAEANQLQEAVGGNIPGNAKVTQIQSHPVVSLHAAVCKNLHSLSTCVEACCKCR